MKRCETCSKFYGEPRIPNIGEQVAFTFQSGTGKRRKLSGRAGKLMLIKEDGFSVTYRGTVYHCDEVSAPDEPSPLTLAFCGVCEFEGKHP